MKVVYTVMQETPIVDILTNSLGLQLRVISQYIRMSTISTGADFIITIRKSSNNSQLLSRLRSILSLITIYLTSGAPIIPSKRAFIANLSNT